MKITEQCVVALTWTLKDTQGEELDTLDEPVEFLVGGNDLLASLEQALQGHEPGETLELQLEPQNAFGDYDDRLLFLEPRHLFPDELEEGMGFEGLPAGCNPSAPKDRLYFVSYMWFDVWPTFWNAKHIPEWQDAMWRVFCEMLALPWREAPIRACKSCAAPAFIFARSCSCRA